MSTAPVSTEDPWNLAEADFPANGAPAEQLRFLLNYAVLAPSSHNSQPWLFHISGNTLELYADRTRALPVVDPFDRALTISCGAALFYLHTAIRHFGYGSSTEILPDPADPDLLARVHLGGPGEASEEHDPLFHAIPKRRTNRQPFADRRVPAALLFELQAATRTEGAWLHIVQREDARNAVADLIAEGDRIQWADERFRRELAAWIHPRRRRDGLGGYRFGITPLIIRTFDLGQGVAAKDRQLAEGSPVLVVLGTAADTSVDWLAAGQALARVLLHAAAEDVSASFLNQPIEVAQLRPRLRDIVGHEGFPQLLLRMGYGSDVQPTPRRPVSDVLI